MSLIIENVTKEFQRGKSLMAAVNNLSLQIHPSETVGLVGESGCGKSTLAKMIVQLEKPSQGRISYNNISLHSTTKVIKKALCRDIQIVFQNPYGALNPRMTLERILNEPLDIHELYTGKQRRSRIEELLEFVRLTKDQLFKYPHQFSGGQCQRICIARALAINPKFLVCDEILSALDLSIQAQIIHLLRDCQKHLQLSMLFISHDLAAVDMLADRVAVMYKGQIVEEGTSRAVFDTPQHPYTKSLLQR